MKKYIVTLQQTKAGLKINENLCTKIHISKNVCSIENNSTGTGHSVHPNISETGSVKGMKEKGYWRKEDKTVKFNGFIYNTSEVVISDPIDALAYYIEKGGKLPNNKGDEWNNIIFEFSI